MQPRGTASLARRHGGCSRRGRTHPSAPPRMPSLLHEAIVTLFRNRPVLAPELVRDALHAPVPSFDGVRVADANLTEVVPTELRADLVLLLDAQRDAVPRAAMIVEVQLATDADKRWTWPAYVATLRARLRCEVALLVVTTDDAVARWAARPITTGHPGFTLAPMVLGPGSLAAVNEDATQARAPERAVLSAVLHARSADAPEMARAALQAVRGLDDERAELYVDLVLASLGDVARAVLEALMASRSDRFLSDAFKRNYAQGREEGRQEGRAEARADDVLRVLAARGIEVPADLRERILSCTDLARLDTWLARAVTASSAAEVVGE